MIYAFSGVPEKFTAYQAHFHPYPAGSGYDGGDLSCLGFGRPGCTEPGGGIVGGYGLDPAVVKQINDVDSRVKIAAVTLLPAIVGGVIGHKWKAHHVVGMIAGFFLLPVVTVYAVNAFYPRGIRGFVGM